MPPVKGSKQLSMKVVPNRPRLDLAVRLGLVCGFLVLAVAAYLLGFAQGVSLNGDSRRDRSILQLQSEAQKQQIDELKARLLFTEQSGVVDRQSLDEVQDTLLAQRELIHRLEQDLGLYRQVMDPEAEEELRIGDVSLESVAAGTGHWNWRVQLLQGADAEQVAGSIAFSVSGTRSGEQVALEPLQLHEDAAIFAFRYFDNLEGSFALPDGFMPVALDIHVHADGRGQIVGKSLPWQSLVSAEE